MAATPPLSIEDRIRALLGAMTLDEKVGQLWLRQGDGGTVSDALRSAIRGGRVGGILNEVDPEVTRELQRLATEESRLGIPLLVGRDVVHGFETVFPIPLGLAATWNPDLVESCSRVAAEEAAACGVNWTFAPMIDIGRDPRWGRIAETFGEDPVLTGTLAAASIRGFQGETLADPDSLAACAKHFAGYGASEGGRDYNSTPLTERELRAVHFPPFRASVEAGVASIMPSFSDVDGIPATANPFLLRQVLREEWGFDGLVASDWNAVIELSVHGLTEGDREAAREAALAGTDMEMASHAYTDHFQSLLEAGEISEAHVDEMVSNVLRLKLRLGLFDHPQHREQIRGGPRLDLAQEAAVQSLVLLRNEHDTLPLNRERIRTLAVIGPLADEPYEQLGTWVFDGDPEKSQTPLQSLRQTLGDTTVVRYARGVETTRSLGRDGFADAVEAAQAADVALLFVGEESILSGEAHCRAELELPGAQAALIDAVERTGTPIVLVVLAGRPLALTDVLSRADAVLYAWHPGTMAGPAITDVLLGDQAPSGRLPVTFPKSAGQIPVYHAHKNTGRPPTPETVISIGDIPVAAPQTSVGNTSFYLDAGAEPLFPFGFGLSYTRFEYRDVRVSPEAVPLGGTVTVRATVQNVGAVEAEEVVQLYVRDPVASATQPVRQLRGFQRVRLASGESREVAFTLHTDDLAIVDRDMRWTTEPGTFFVGIGGDSRAPLAARFEVTG
ncbi:MAG: glycoside hydrolase family 3 N-terminal domain-containing protein [Bacteroidota bacterium]